MLQTISKDHKPDYSLRSLGDILFAVLRDSNIGIADTVKIRDKRNETLTLE